MKLQTPAAPKAEHDELHSELARAIQAGGNTGEAAREVAKLMHPHFTKEEEYALPPLGLLAALSEGKVTEEMAEVMNMTDKLEAQLPQMLAEHREIVKALRSLADAATAERKPAYAHFAERLMAHALTEEEVSYPAALLTGRYLKAVLPLKYPSIKQVAGCCTGNDADRSHFQCPSGGDQRDVAS